MAITSVVTGILSRICGGILDLREDTKLNPYSSPSFISVCHGCSVSKARVVFPGGSYSTGTLHGSQGIQTKGGSSTGHWEVEGGSAMGRARVRH